MGEAIEVVVLVEKWAVGGKDYVFGETLLIDSDTLEEHQAAGRCEPVDANNKTSTVTETPAEEATEGGEESEA